MPKKTVRWGVDIGLAHKIKPLEPRTDLSDHGLKGSLQEGDLGFSRRHTRSIARKDARDGIPTSEAMTQDQWSEREQEVAEKAEKVRRGLGTWLSATSTKVRNFIQGLHARRPLSGSTP